MNLIFLIQCCFYGSLWGLVFGAIFHWALSAHWYWGFASGFTLYILWICTWLYSAMREVPDKTEDDEIPEFSAPAATMEYSGHLPGEGVNLVHFLTFLFGGGMLSGGLLIWTSWHWLLSILVGYVAFPLLFFLLGYFIDFLDKTYLRIKK